MKNGGTNSFDLTGQNVLSMRDVQTALSAGAMRLQVSERCVVTPLARDFLHQHGIELVAGAPSAKLPPVYQAAFSAPAIASYENGAGNGSQKHASGPLLFDTLEAEAVKAEICAVGKKLWHRQYVDGNGGNISCRIGPNEVICTPTLVSKFDMTPDDLCMVDLEGRQIAGRLPRTSEILLHLEIYKAVPEARAAVHCHPPHATAYAITGRVPPSRIIPEFEVFVGKVAVSPYETPGTKAFAETVLPYVKQHNTVLLANHGIICWADTVTHAEWFAEVVDTYCWTLMLASQLGAPISQISEKHTADLLEIKKRIGLPDARFDAFGRLACTLSDFETNTSIALIPDPRDGVNIGNLSPAPALVAGDPQVEDAMEADQAAKA